MKQSVITILQATYFPIFFLIVLFIGGWRCGGVEREVAEKRADVWLNVQKTRGGSTHCGEDEKEPGVTVRSVVAAKARERHEDVLVRAGETWWYCGESGKSSTVQAILINGTLRVFGKGAMRNYVGFREWAPWRGRYSEFNALRCDSSALSVVDIVIDDGVTHVGSRAFASLPRLKSVSISASVLSMGTDAFDGCDSLMSITVATENPRYYSKDGILFNKNGTTLIWCPSNTALGAYTIPNHVATIEGMAFRDCRNLMSVTIPSSVKVIGEDAFNNCVGLRSVAIENGVTVIRKRAFFGCSNLTSITIPSSVVSIESVFEKCINLSTVTIEDGVKTIERRAFANCTNLISITIPSSVTSIGDSVFFQCDNLVYITNLNFIPLEINEKSLDGLPLDVCLYVPKNSIETYRSADGWSIFVCIKPIADLLSVPALAANTSGVLQKIFRYVANTPNDQKYHILKISGQKYKTVKIGKQIWMAENLNYGGSYYCYDEDGYNCETNGSLYDWDAAMSACPKGWHLPSRQEWRTLVAATGDRRVAGRKLKSKTGWRDDGGKGGNGTNDFGFSAIPGGLRSQNTHSVNRLVSVSHDTFYGAGFVGYWWSATGHDQNSAYGRYMNSDINGVHEGYYNKRQGLSVRCVKDK